MDEDWKRYLKMAASGALTGGLMGGVGKILSGSRSIPAIIGSAASGGLAGGVSIPSASALGESILGAPDSDESQPYTKRAGLGGAVTGALGGGALGGLAGGGVSSRLAEKMPGVANFVTKNIPVDNLLVDIIKKKGPMKGALLGALLGGVGLGYLSADEGQQFDTLQNLSKENSGGTP